jgi:hypothetical protein
MFPCPKYSPLGYIVKYFFVLDIEVIITHTIRTVKQQRGVEMVEIQVIFDNKPPVFLSAQDIKAAKEKVMEYRYTANHVVFKWEDNGNHTRFCPIDKLEVFND